MLNLLDLGIPLNELLLTKKEEDIYPSVDFVDSKEKITVLAEIPGVSNNDISVKLNGNTLIISGERKAPQAEEDITCFREINYGKFARSIGLPDGIDSNKISAGYKDGILKIEFPKTDENKIKEIKILPV